MQKRRMWKDMLTEVGAHFRDGQSDGEISGVPFHFHEGWCDELPMLVVIGAAASPTALHMTHYAHVLALPEMPANWNSLSELPYKFNIAGLILLCCKPLNEKQIKPFQRIVVCNPAHKQESNVPMLMIYSIEDLPKSFNGSKVLDDLHPESDIFVGHMDELLHGQSGPIVERIRNFLNL